MVVGVRESLYPRNLIPAKVSTNKVVSNSFYDDADNISLNFIPTLMIVLGHWGLDKNGFYIYWLH